jgi:hypothetical protein
MIDRMSTLDAARQKVAAMQQILRDTVPAAGGHTSLTDIDNLVAAQQEYQKVIDSLSMANELEILKGIRKHRAEARIFSA